jgi:hypothetical protein
MMALLDTSQDLDQCAAEIGGEVGQLLTPLTRYRLRDPDRPWGIDNGGYSRFEGKAFDALLRREEHHKDKCLFVTAPDVVGSARRTLEIFEFWKPKLKGWKVALACQDGQEHLPMPWDAIDAVFIGGSTNFKCGDGAAQIVRAAKILDKWVHIGRVNHPARFDHFAKLGADSFDGTGVARFTHMREAIGNRDQQGAML